MGRMLTRGPGRHQERYFRWCSPGQREGPGDPSRAGPQRRAGGDDGGGEDDGDRAGTVRRGDGRGAAAEADGVFALVAREVLGAGQAQPPAVDDGPWGQVVQRVPRQVVLALGGGELAEDALAQGG